MYLGDGKRWHHRIAKNLKKSIKQFYCGIKIANKLAASSGHGWQLLQLKLQLGKTSI